MGKLLIVDDEANVLAAIQNVLADHGHAVVTAQRADNVLGLIESEKPDVAVLDIFMPGTNGLEALRRIKQAHAKLPVILMTGQGTMDTAIEATKLGAFDYQVKPFEPQQMLLIIEHALQSARLMHRPVELDSAAVPSNRDALVGQSAVMQEVYKAIGRVAPTDATVLIRGESGTGKELVARAIYQHSLRSDAPLVAVNCAAVPEALLEAELFGFERGAFTGALARRVGKFEHASGGTIFLDEIGDIPIAIQAKILRVLQERSIERIGGNETIDCNVRILAATNRNLEKAIKEGEFREDLYHRLRVAMIDLPPLRERREDLPALIEYLRRWSARELGTEAPPWSDEALRALIEYSWPGNVRELQNCIHRLTIFARGHSIQVADVERALADGGEPRGDVPGVIDDQLAEIVRRHLGGNVNGNRHELLMDKLDRLMVVEALRACGGNQTQAARMLGLSRPTLHAKIQKYRVHARTVPEDFY